MHKYVYMAETVIIGWIGTKWISVENVYRYAK